MTDVYDATNTAFVDQPVKTFDFYIHVNEMFVSSIKHFKTGRRKASAVELNRLKIGNLPYSPH